VFPASLASIRHVPTPVVSAQCDPDGQVRHIGKESHQLEDREAELALDPDELLTEYVNPSQDDFEKRVVTLLRKAAGARDRSSDGPQRTDREARASRRGKAAPRDHREAQGVRGRLGGSEALEVDHEQAKAAICVFCRGPRLTPD
jgi:hypothetical protein